MARKDFNFSTNDDKGEDHDEKTEDGMMPDFSKFETKNSKYIKNLGSERFNEPRMFTMEQIRNITFACLNNSTIQDRVTLNEHRYVKVHKTCLQLDEIDRQLRHQSLEMNTNITNKVN